MYSGIDSSKCHGEKEEGWQVSAKIEGGFNFLSMVTREATLRKSTCEYIP